MEMRYDGAMLVLPRDIDAGNRIEQITVDLDTVWVEVASVHPRKVLENGKRVTKSYLVSFVGIDHQPITLRPTQRVAVNREA